MYLRVLSLMGLLHLPRSLTHSLTNNPYGKCTTLARAQPAVYILLELLRYEMIRFCLASTENGHVSIISICKYNLYVNMVLGHSFFLSWVCCVTAGGPQAGDP